jgi:hypothetical protein
MAWPGGPRPRPLALAPARPPSGHSSSIRARRPAAPSAHLEKQPRGWVGGQRAEGWLRAPSCAPLSCAPRRPQCPRSSPGAGQPVRPSAQQLGEGVALGSPARGKPGAGQRRYSVPWGAQRAQAPRPARQWPSPPAHGRRVAHDAPQRHHRALHIHKRPLRGAGRRQGPPGGKGAEGAGRVRDPDRGCGARSGAAGRCGAPLGSGHGGLQLRASGLRSCCEGERPAGAAAGRA